MTLTAALLVLAARPQSVTLTSSLAPSAVVLAELGKAARVEMKPSGSVNKDVFFVHFADTPLDVAMKRVAETLNATWTKQPDGSYLLGRTQAQDLDDGGYTRDLRDSVRKSLAETQLADLDDATVKKAISDAEVVVKSDGKGFEYADVNRFGLFNPPERLGIRLLKIVGPDAIANIPDGEVVWFASAPTTKQRSLPADAARALDLYVAEAKAVSRAFPPDYHQPPGLYVSFLNQAHIDTGQPFKFGFNVTRQGDSVFGTVILEQGDVEEVESAELLPPREQPQPGNALTKLKEPFTLDDEHMRLVEVLKSVSELGALRDAVADKTAWRAVFNDAGRRDFTTVLAASFMTQTAQALKQDMVAVMSDLACCEPLRSQIKQERENTLGEVWGQVSRFFSGLRISEGGGYVSVRPRDKMVGRDRLDRRILARVMSRPGNMTLGLDDMADLVAGTESDDGVKAGMAFIGLANAGIFQDSVSSIVRQPDVLRIYGRLSPDQRDRAKKDSCVVPLSSLPANLRKPVERLVYGHNMKLTTDLSDFEQVSLESEVSVGGMTNFSSFCLGNGFPAGSQLRITAHADERLLVGQQGLVGRFRAMTAEDAASSIAYAQSPAGQANDYYKNYPIVGLSVVPDTELVLTFEFPDAGVQRRALVIPELKSDPKYLAPGELPAKWRDALLPKIAQFQEMYKSLPVGSAAPPPPQFRF